MSNNKCRPTNDGPTTTTISPAILSVGGAARVNAPNGSFGDGAKCEGCRYHLTALPPMESGTNGARLTFRRKHFANASFSSSISRHGGRCFRFVTSREFLFTVIVVLALFAITCLIALLVVSARKGRPVEDADFLNSHSDWRDNCERTCNKKFDVPPLLLISMDGFRADYLNHDLTPAVKRIMSCGTRAEYMLPSYPSKTFPNHYSIVTGLYPESHGIVDNLFMDSNLPEIFFSKKTNDSAWYWGEPIWNTVAKNNRKSATFYWPGSEVPIQGIRPTYLYLYNKSTPFSKRVDQVLYVAFHAQI